MKNLIVVILLALSPLFMSFNTAEPAGKKMRIVIDTGHGGQDNGVLVNEISEKEITEAIGRKIKFLNNDHLVDIIVLKGKDEFMSLSDRVNKINEINPDMVISLHINADSDTTVHGLDAFIGEKNVNSEASKEIAESIINAAPNSLSKRNVKEANLYILNNVKCPAVLLEIGYLTNEKDREYLTSQIGQQRIAEMILRNLSAK